MEDVMAAPQVKKDVNWKALEKEVFDCLGIKSECLGNIRIDTSKCEAFLGYMFIGPQIPDECINRDEFLKHAIMNTDALVGRVQCLLAILKRYATGEIIDAASISHQDERLSSPIRSRQDTLCSLADLAEPLKAHPYL